MEKIYKNIRVSLYRYPTLWDNFQKQVLVNVRNTVNIGNDINQLIVFQCRSNIYNQLQEDIKNELKH